MSAPEAHYTIPTEFPQDNYFVSHLCLGVVLGGGGVKILKLSPEFPPIIRRLSAESAQTSISSAYARSRTNKRLSTLPATIPSYLVMGYDETSRKPHFLYKGIASLLCEVVQRYRPLTLFSRR